MGKAIELQTMGGDGRSPARAASWASTAQALPATPGARDGAAR